MRTSTDRRTFVAETGAMALLASATVPAATTSQEHGSEGVRLRNSPFWNIHPVLCRNVTVRGVDVFGHGPNNDGLRKKKREDLFFSSHPRRGAVHLLISRRRNA